MTFNMSMKNVDYKVYGIKGVNFFQTFKYIYIYIDFQ